MMKHLKRNRIAAILTEDTTNHDAKEIVLWLCDRDGLEVGDLKNRLSRNVDLLIEALVSYEPKEVKKPTYTVSEAARLVDKHRNTISNRMTRWKEEGLLKNGRIPHEILELEFGL